MTGETEDNDLNGEEARIQIHEGLAALADGVVHLRERTYTMPLCTRAAASFLFRWGFLRLRRRRRHHRRDCCCCC